MSNPVESAELVPHGDDSRLPAGRAGKMRVLVVDDEPGILELLKTALGALGAYDVSIASSGLDALRIIDTSERPFDCLLLDIQMPKMNGIALCREVRQIPLYQDTPIIMLTAMSEKKYVDQAFTSGATDYLTKPFDFLELRSRLGTARKLNQERGRASESIHVARKLKEELDTTLQFSIEDPICLAGVERVLGYSQFENYVLQLSKGRRFTSFATAIKIARARLLHGSMTSADFRAMLHDTAFAISKVTRDSGNVLSYRGNGTYLCVSENRKKTPLATSETHMNQMVATMLAQKRIKADVQLLVGDSFPMRALTRLGALYSLNRAIENVELRDQDVEEVASFSKRVLKSRALSSEEAHLERRSYEVILQQLLREDQSLRRI